MFKPVQQMDFSVIVPHSSSMQHFVNSRAINMLIKWVLNSSVGTVPTQEIINAYHGYNGTVPDPDYLSELEECHGGVPELSCILDKLGRRHRIGRFVNFLDSSSIRGPLQPSFIDPRTDRRLWWSFDGLMTLENLRSGFGKHLMPFALLCSGQNHSDKMDPTHGDLMCFNYVKGAGRVPSVVYWNNDLAQQEYFRSEDSGESPYTDMKLEAFTVPVANSFGDFASMLKLN